PATWRRPSAARRTMRRAPRTTVKTCLRGSPWRASTAPGPSSWLLASASRACISSWLSTEQTARWRTWQCAQGPSGPASSGGGVRQGLSNGGQAMSGTLSRMLRIVPLRRAPRAGARRPHVRIPHPVRAPLAQEFFRLIRPRTPAGVMELLPREQIAFQRMLDVIRRNYERFGFLPVETPVFELSDVLLTKSGGETERQVYFVQSTGALANAAAAGAAGGLPEMRLRSALPVPPARYGAEHEHELRFPFRRCQMQRVYRGGRAQRGRFREFYQCDLDVIGKDALRIRYDAEVLAV